MRRSGDIPWGKLKVGALIIAAFVVFLWTSFKIPGPKFLSRKHSAWVFINDVNGMVSGSPVRIGGVPVGTVAKLDFSRFDKERMVGVRIELGEEHWKLLHKDATATMGTVGLLGDMYIAIDPGSHTSPPLPDGGTIVLHESASIASLAPRLSTFLDSLQSAVDVTTNMLHGVAGGHGSIGAMMTRSDLHDSMVRMANAGTVTAANVSTTSVQFNEQMQKLSRDLQELLRMAKSPNSTTGALLSDRALYDNALRTSARLDSLTDALQHEGGGGSAGAALRDKELYLRATAAVAGVESLLAEVQRHPNKFFKFSVF